MADEKKGFTGITRDLTMAGIGFGFGFGTAVIVGNVTDSIRTPEEQKAAQEAAAKAKAAGATKQG